MSRTFSRRIAEGKRPDLVILNSIQTLWTDAAEFGAGHGHAGARLGAGDDPLRQVDRRGDRAGRPCHQGRPDRRPARRRAHGRRRALFRGRRRPSLPHPARGQEPLRPDRRDRRVRNVGHAACARSPTRPSCSSASATPSRRARRSSPAWRARGRCWSRSRRWSRRRRSARRAAPSSAGTRPGCRWCSRCSKRIAACASRQHDVYLNVAGGYRITEPAADLAVAAALVSSLTGLALPADCVYFGEISLSGAVRPVAHAHQRLKEAEKLGFGQAVLPCRQRTSCRAGSEPRPFQPATLTDLVVRIAGSQARTGGRLTASSGSCGGLGSRDGVRTTCRLRCLTEFSSASRWFRQCWPWCAASRARSCRSPPGWRRRRRPSSSIRRAALRCSPISTTSKIAMAAAAGVVFVVALIVVTLITMKIADFIIDSRVGALDRTLGFLYGAARGILVVAVGAAVLQLAGRRQPAGMDHRRQVAAAARNRSAPSSRACCRTIRKTRS